LFNSINIQSISTKLGRNDSNMMFLMKKYIFSFFPEKTEVPFFPGKKSGIPGKRRKFVFYQSEAVWHTLLCTNISKKPKSKPKNGFKWHEYTYI